MTFLPLLPYLRDRLLAILPWLAGLLALLAAFFGYGRIKKGEGRDALKAEQAEETIKNMEKANEAEREVHDSYRTTGQPPERVRKFYIPE